MATVKGTAEINAKLKKLMQQMPHRIKAALYQEMLIEERESRARTPVEFGNLRGSHVTRPPTQEGNTFTVRIEVGGSAAPYALHVHENLEAYHEVGQAKFLESTILESAPHMAGRIAKRIKIEDLL